IYGLYVSLPLIPPELDDHPNNNQKAIGIGCDATPPTSSHTLTPASPDGNNSWYVSDVTVTVTSTDPTSHDVASGVQEIQYKIDSGTWQTKPGNTATFKVTTDGNHVVQYKGVDNVGNEETPKSVSFKIDKTKPDMVMTYEVTGGNQYQGWELTFTVNATDATSGMDKVEFYFNGNLQTTVPGAGPTYTWVFTYFPLPNVDIKATAYDKAGNNRFEIIHNPQNSQNQQSQQSHIVLKQRVVR
ncbi:MAG: Ig-like domain-containing protein, partial [Euryarchaeota archaeon]|nr:Ig-like domain-containing protein [Euryarchaeota archaeon]